jgi:hypothetical protein
MSLLELVLGIIISKRHEHGYMFFWPQIVKMCCCLYVNSRGQHKFCSTLSFYIHNCSRASIKNSIRDITMILLPRALSIRISTTRAAMSMCRFLTSIFKGQ